MDDKVVKNAFASDIAKMTEVTFNFLSLIYDGMKEENLNFKNL